MTMARSIPAVAAAACLLVSGASAFLLPSASTPSSSRLYSADGMALASGGLRPSTLDLSQMTVHAGQDALLKFQEKRKAAAIISDAEHEPVEHTMKRFNNLYGRPVIPFYRTTLYELVQ
ncbi:hypothetical protein VYU27_009897, partial [Nannochloropsis oceanica]